MEEDKHYKQEVAVSLAAANEISIGGSVSTISSELVDGFLVLSGTKDLLCRNTCFRFCPLNPALAGV